MKLCTFLTKPFVLFVLLFALGVGSVWGWDLADGRKVYFNMQNQTDFGTPYFRIGRHDGGDWSAATQMTLVSGTKYVYIYTQSGKWENYGAFSVADGKGFTNSNNIYQPWSGQPGSEGYTGDVIISKQTLFQKYDVTSDAYINITGTGTSSNGCQYYQANGHTTDDGGALTALPSYSVTYNTPDHGTLTVTRYDGSSYNSFSSGADDFKPTEIIKITTSAATHYVLDELEVVGATQIESGDTYYVTANCTITATFAPQWSINGTMTSPAWDIYNGLEFVSDNTYRGEITLSAGTAYNFKVLDRATNTWYGCGTRDNDYTYVGQTDAVAINSTNASGHNVMLMTTKAGEYTFEWNDNDHTLKITYPSAIVHPSFDYVYIEKYTGGGAWGDYYMHYWYTDGEGDHPLTTWGTDDAKMSAYTHIGNTDYYYFPILADYPKFVAKNNVGNETDKHKTDDMVTTGNAARLVYWKDEPTGWTWKDLTVHIALNDLTPTTHVVPTYLDVAFNSEVLTDLTTTPTKTHYDFGGFYTGYDAENDVAIGTQVIDEGGHWIASVADYTDASKQWIHPGCSTTVYAKWTKHPYEITLTVTPSAPVDGTDSLQGGTITVNSEVETSINAYWTTESAEIQAVPANDAYIFKEWRFSKTGEAYDVYVSDEETYSSTSNPIKIMAQHDGTLTAVFQCRYGLIGSLTGSDASGHGMPGWVFNDAVDFKVISFTSLGEGADKVNLQCPRTLDPNTQYKFRILDRVKKNSVGGATEDGVLPEQYNPPTYYNNWQLKDMTGAGGQDVLINTKGRGTYTFHITNMSNDGYYWPSIQVDRQLSYQLTLAWQHAEAEAPSSYTDGDVGGTVYAGVDEGDGNRVQIITGQYFADGSTIKFDAHPATSYNHDGNWYSSNSYSDAFMTGGSTKTTDALHADFKVYVKFDEKTNTFEGDETGHETEWNQTGNWSAGHIPTINEVAIIPKQVVVDITDAKAKRVLIKNDSPNNGQIEIPAGKELIVAQTIKQTTDGSTYGATGENDIIIGSTLANGNGALVMNTNDGTNKATVYFATKAKTVEQAGEKHNVNQFIGTPFNDENDILYDYYGTKIYEFKAGQDGNIGGNWWRRLAGTGDKMHGFLGYNILTNQTTEPVLEMTGTLCKAEEHSVNGYYGDASHKEYLFANSWVAPIYIPNFDDGDFTNMDKTIYIFNAGTVVDQGEHSTADGSADNTSPGQYVVLPIHASPWVGMKVIPSMQAFSVFANDENPKLTFNYERLVYNPALATGEDHAGIVPNRAPQRTNDADAPSVLRLAATGESGYAAKIVLLERTDFTDGYDDGWDGRFLAGDDAAPQLYAVTSDGNMAINSIPNIEGTLLGFKAGEADDLFTFSFDYEGEVLYLYDTQTQLYTRVLTGNTYTFATTDNAAHNRFILTHKAPSVVTGIEQGNSPSQVTNKMIIDNHLYIFRGGVLYDALGRMISNGKEAGL